MSEKVITVIKVQQNDTFELFLSKMTVKFLVDHGVVLRRGKDKNGVQRSLDTRRAKNIQQFAETNTAVFPTPIIISVGSDRFKSEKLSDMDAENWFFEYENSDSSDSIFFKIIDGQHRLEGLKLAFENTNGVINPEIPVVFMVDGSLYDEAYVFSTINANQKSVSKSLIFDLFDDAINDQGFVQKSVEGTVHYIIKQLNNQEDSALCQRVKMLGIKSSDTQWISQGTMGTQFSKLITSEGRKEADNRAILYGKVDQDSRYPLRSLWIEGQTEIMTNLFKNYFNAFAHNFSELWDKPLSETTQFHKQYRENIENFQSEDDKTLKYANTNKTLGFMILTKFLGLIYYKQFPKFREQEFSELFKNMAQQNPDAFYKVFITRGSGEGIAKKESENLFRIYEETIK